jgi:hypothetical protein
MTRPILRSPWLPATRAASAVLVLVWLWTAAVPIVDGMFHTDDRCCANGICCCRPKPSPTGWGVRAACACGGHDNHDAGLPMLRPCLVSARFRLTLPSGMLDAPGIGAAAPDKGYLRHLDHPPDLRVTPAS